MGELGGHPLDAEGDGEVSPFDPGNDDEQWYRDHCFDEEEIRLHAHREDREENREAVASPFIGGGSFFQDVPENPESVWGSGGDVLWAKGEALIITGPQGVGKTTVAMQVVRARIGLQETVLGLPVEPEPRKVLYLTMDRPAQAQRAGNRIFCKDDQGYLNEHLVIWKGPPPMDMAKNPAVLIQMCEKAGAGTVIVDSLKDAAIGLSNDEVGAGYNRARQKAIVEGVEVLELHHPVKNSAGGGEPKELKDVYGSTWITSGAGSVISLYGEAGDPVVAFRHLKQPMNEVGPFKVTHDHQMGMSSVVHGVDVFELVRAYGANGLEVVKYAEALFETKNPTPAQREKARRKLEGMVSAGTLARVDGASSKSPSTYYLAGQ